MIVAGAAIIAAAAVFLGFLAITNSVGATRRLVRERALGFSTSQPPNQISLTLPRIETLSERGQRIKTDLERAGLSLTATEYTAIRVAMALSAALGAVLLANRFELTGPVRALLPVIGFVVGFYLPARWVLGRKQRRLALIEDQLVDALTSVAKSLRTGLGLMQAIDFAARETPAPLGPELGRLLRQVQLGSDFETELDRLNATVGSPDLEIAATAITIQRRVGGTLSEILSTVADTIRERRSLRREVQVLTARQRLTGNTAAVLPVLVALGTFAINPDLARLLIERSEGRIALGIGIGFELLGLLLIRRFAKIEV